MTLTLGPAAIAYGFFVLSYFTWCKPDCAAAATTVAATMTTAALTGLAGTILAATKLARKTRAFPTAFGTVIITAIVIAVGTITYITTQ